MNLFVAAGQAGCVLLLLYGACLVAFSVFADRKRSASDETEEEAARHAGGILK